MLKQIVKLFGGDPHKQAIEEYAEIVDHINSLEPQFEAMSEEELRARTDEFRARLSQGETLDDILPQAFAAVREASKRTIGQRHFDVQLIGGVVLHQGKIAEMRTGEGKTLMATLPLYLNALAGMGAHLVTVNDYLARRDARWMAPIYVMLGLQVGVLQMASRTEHGRKAFLVDLEAESPHEDQHQLVMVPRREAYAADITYGTNNEFGFDYLRDNMAMRLGDRVQRGHHYAIIDEVDNVLIDEARTPLIISGPSHDDADNYLQMAQIVKQLRPEDYEVNEKDRHVVLTEIGELRVEDLLGQPLRDPDRPEDITPEQAQLMGYLEQALRAQYLFKRNKDYLVQSGNVIIIDEFTGRLMPGRRWSDGLHQAVEAKEGVKVQSENVTYATVTIQNYFRMYEKLSGMTGTALTEAEEFEKIYSLDVVAIPPNVEYNAVRPEAPLSAHDAQDEYGYKYTYYAYRDDAEGAPVFFKRKDYPDVVYRTEEAKLRAIVQEILTYHVIGRPILVGTTSVEKSEMLSNRLRAQAVRTLAQTLLLRSVWMERNNRVEDGRIILALQFLNEPLENLQASEMRKLARQLEMSLNPEAPENVRRLLEIFGLEGEHEQRLVNALKGGVPHQVLNARRHTEESQIIAGAGAFGAVTIATNMAGRGVDIKLGGEIAEQVLSVVSRVLRRAGYENPYELSLEEQRDALRKLDSSDYGIYDAEVRYFLKSMEDMDKVKELGGLHVIGSERHEARRIDNQLRGRAGRQGDPGSSRFFLAMEDDLMRLFGGQQVDSMMQRMGMDDALPLEVGLVSRIIEQSQTRVEGANFDARKHLLEYDDVLNSQREKIYAQRDRIFTKDDLSEDVREMLETEVTLRVPDALLDEEGPWRLLAWLEQIQPSFIINNVFFPSLTYRLLLDDLKSRNFQEKPAVREAMLDLAEKSINAEEAHLIRSVEQILERTRFRQEEQLDERMDTLDVFFEGLSLADETDTRGPSELLDELSAELSVPLKLSNAQGRLLREDPEEAAELVAEQVENFLVTQAMTRLVGAVERRLDESLELNPSDLAGEEWGAITSKVLEAIEGIFEERRRRLLGEQGDGQIARDLENHLARIKGAIHEVHLLNLLIQMPQGEVTTFDKKTHRRMKQRTTRLTYFFHAADYLQDLEPEEVTERVLKHLESARKAMQQVWGRAHWERLADARLESLDENVRRGLARALGEETLQGLNSQPLKSLPDEQRGQAIHELGRQALTEIYRQLLLRVISDLWVDYLTQMEALRVSIGLEAYAQRDPLVQYKARAYQMFQKLFEDMRSSVVNRMFTFTPQAMSQPQVSGAPPTPVAQGEESAQERPQAASKSKRKRRRRRR